MLSLREVKKEDLGSLLDLFQKGVTSLPKTKEHLLHKISLSLKSFAGSPNVPGNEYYFFVLEEDGKVIGTSSIKATAATIPTFRKILDSHASLQIVTERPDASELCALVLHEKVRHHGYGHLLSQGRFLYIADHLTRFHDLLVADIRGFLTPEGHCPFWEGVCRPFCHLSYDQAEHLYRTDPHQLEHLLPHYPIYISELSKEVQEVIGKTHPFSKGALQILVHEGFHVGEEIHPLDGGPRVIANLLEIRSIREGGVGVLSDQAPKKGIMALISTVSSPFRATEGLIEILPHGHLALSTEAREALHLSPGDHLRYLEIKK